MSLSALALGALLALPGAAPASAPRAGAAAPKAPAKAARPEAKKPRPPQVLRLEELRVEGRIQKPEAFYVLQRSQLSFGELTQPESSLPRVLESVEKPPF